MDQQIKYDLKTSARAKYLRISVYPDSRVVVTKPVSTSLAKAEEFVNRKSHWILKKLAAYKKRKSIPLLNPQSMSKQDALRFVTERVNFYNQYYKLPVGKISVKNLRSLWGSCSSRRNLNFNHRIVHLPQYQSDYIIVHELCHIKEMNHSKQFWDLVAYTIPNYKKIKQELKSYLFQ
jgi:predicted metal-dependent hydrolase